MVPSEKEPVEVLEQLLTSFSGLTLPGTYEFSHTANVVLFQEVADMVREQRAATYVMTDRTKDDAARYITVWRSESGKTAFELLYNNSPSWRTRGSESTTGSSYQSTPVRRTSEELVTYIERSGFRPIDILNDILETTQRVISEKLTEYRTREANIAGMLANTRIIRAKIVLMSHAPEALAALEATK